MVKELPVQVGAWHLTDDWYAFWNVMPCLR
jgi:hypothetical protein